MGFPVASRAVTVIVLFPDPAVIDAAAAVAFGRVPFTAPAVTVTLAVCVIATVLIVAEIVFPPVVVELNVAVRTPVVGSVVPVAGVRVFPVPPDAVRLTLAPPTGFPLASRAVTVIVEEPPAGIDAGAAATVEVVADTAPAVTVTLAVCVIATVLIVAEIVFPPVVVELNVA